MKLDDRRAPGSRKGRLRRRRPAQSRTDSSLTLWVSSSVLIAALLLGIVDALLPIMDARETVGHRLSEPSLTHPLGTDELGRSVLARIAEGVRLTFLLPAGGVLIALIIGATVGIGAAYRGRWLDQVVSRSADVLSSIPAVLVAILFAVILGPGTRSAIIAIAWTVLPSTIRILRAAAMNVVDQDYVTSARVAGLSTSRIVIRHVVPNIAGPTLVQAAYALSLGMVIESGLSFLGLGVQPPDASLGSLASVGSSYISAAPWLALAPGVVLAACIVSANLLGSELRVRLDPLQQRAMD